MRTSVVLPAPFGPRRPKTMPSGTSRSTPASAVVHPDRLTTLSTRMAGDRVPPDPVASPADADVVVSKHDSLLGYATSFAAFDSLVSSCSPDATTPRATAIAKTSPGF